MQIADKKIVKPQFNKNIYEINSPVFVTSDNFWDGGIDCTVSLKEKARFYSIAETMSSVLKEFISTLNEDIYVGELLCENEKMYAEWSDLKKAELFRIVSKTFKRDKCYKLSLSEDSEIIDLIIESNFRYYSYISLFLSSSNIIVQPTCHTELIIYSENSEYVKNTLEKIIEPHSNIKVK